MKLSARAEYACLAVIALARQGPDRAPVPVRKIAKDCGIPERFLVQILLQLKGAGMVESTRGSSGGYRLARPAEGISLGEVLSVIEGPGEPPREAQGMASRVLASVLEHIDAAERAMLDRTSIDQLARQISDPDWVI